MKSFQGSAHNISEPLLGRVVRKHLLFDGDHTVVIQKFRWGLGHKALLTTNNDLPKQYVKMPCVYGVSQESLSELHDGDVIKVYPDGNIVRLWEYGSDQNVIFVTDKCNCHCIMCPQPCDSCSTSSFLHENEEILNIISPETNSICFSGGEPTLEPKQLESLLAICKRRFSNACISILTNGIALSNFNIIKRIVEQGNKLLFCVSLHGDVNDVHDKIMGVEGAFAQTMRGLYNLARFKCWIELRFVIMRQNYERLPYYAEFIYRNLTFVSHVAFMGLEYTGEAARNIENIEIDPVEYSILLRKAILCLHRRGMNVSIYNIPRCLLSRDIWRFSRDSISTWKKTFLDICDSCEEKVNCCGLFKTSVYISPHISPITSSKIDNNRMPN